MIKLIDAGHQFLLDLLALDAEVVDDGAARAALSVRGHGFHHVLKHVLQGEEKREEFESNE